MHTKVEKYFSKEKPSITILSFSEEKYIYKISYESFYYILKGYKNLLCPISDSNAKEIYIELVRKLGLIYQEYYLSKVDSSFSPHYIKALKISSSFEPAEDSEEDGAIYTEILFEYGGKGLDTFRKKSTTGIKHIYNWMRQSANALAILHAAGISHLDIKPSNMVYDDKKDILKIIDMGSSTTYTSRTQMFSSTKSLTKKVRELTVFYSPPEILQAVNNKTLINTPLQNPIEFVIGNIDVYCWAMCFYALLLKKNDKELGNDISKYKLENSERYEKFLISMQKDIDGVNTKDPEEVKILNLIKGILTKALQYNPKNRPKLELVIRNMKTFEYEQRINFKYRTIEKITQEKVFKRYSSKRLLVISDSSAVCDHDKLDDIKCRLEELKIEIDNLNRTKNIIKERILEKKKLLMSKAKVTDKALIKIRKTNQKLKKDLEMALGNMHKLEKTLVTEKGVGSSLTKKCESYKELEIRYNHDTTVLNREKEIILKKIQQVYI